jgi:hypothetical protein
MSKKIGSRGPLYFPKRRGMAWVGMEDFLCFSNNPGLAKEEPSCSPTLRRSNLCGTRCSKEGFCMIELPEELLCNQSNQWGGGIGEIKKGNRSHSCEHVESCPRHKATPLTLLEDDGRKKRLATHLAQGHLSWKVPDFQNDRCCAWHQRKETSLGSCC